MGHNLDITDGIVSAAFARVDAWHRLGETLPGEFTVAQAMEHAHLGGWDVRKLPLSVQDDATGLMIPVSNQFGIVRTNPINGRTDSLGVAGSRYTPVQNEEHAQFLTDLVDESGAILDTAGAIDGGRKVFITMKLPGHMQVGGVDRVDTYLAALNSHDGSMPFTVMVTPTRVVCQNTFNIAMNGHSHKFTARHTRGATRKIGEARQALELSFKYLDDFSATAEQLVNTTLTQAKFMEIMTEEFGPKTEDKGAATRAATLLDTMEMLFAEAGTHAEVRDTAWAGFNAVVEYADHFSNVHGTDKDETRAKRVLFDPDYKIKAKALDLMMAQV